jgi:iron(III) transport system ATP-binding protein
VADFIGEANFLPVRVVEQQRSGVVARLGRLTLLVPETGLAPGPATLVVRPEGILIRRAAPGPLDDGVLVGRVRQAAYLGVAGEYVVETDVGAIAVTDPVMAEGLLPPDSTVWLTFQARGLSLLPEGASVSGTAP